MKAKFRVYLIVVLALAAVFALSLGLAACNPTEEEPPTDEVTITFSETSLSLETGGSQVVSVTVTGSDEEAQFTSGNTGIVTVAKGAAKNSVRITAAGVGSTNVTAAIGEASATLPVTVTAAAAEDSVSFEEKGISIEKGSSETLTVRLNYTSAEEGRLPAVTASDDSLFEIGQVQASGSGATFTLALKAGADFGSADLTATIGTATATIAADVCSAGILFDEETISSVRGVVSGLSAEFEGGALVFPRYAYSDNEGAFIPVTEIGTGSAAIANAGGAITSVDTGDGATAVAAHAFEEIVTIQSLRIGKNVVTVGESAFAHTPDNGEEQLSALGTITFADGCALTSIGTVAFRNSAIEEIVFPDKLQHSGQQSFFACTNLKKVTLPESLIPGSANNVDSGTFWGCTAIEEVNMPAYAYAPLSMFAQCENIKIVNFGGTKAQWLAMEEETAEQFPDNNHWNNGLWNCENIVCTDGKLPIRITFVTEPISALASDATADIEVTGLNIENIVFSSEDETLVTVAAKGTPTSTGASATVTPTGTKLGTTNIVATCGHVSVKLSVTVVDPSVDSVQMQLTYKDLGKSDGAFTVPFTYTASTENTDATPSLTATEGQTLVDLGEVVKGSTDASGITSATFTVTPKSDGGYGTVVVTVTLGLASAQLTVEVCSSGIVYQYGTDTAAVSGVNDSFTEGELHVPSYTVHEGTRYFVTQIGVGGETALAGANKITVLYTGDMVSNIQPYALSGAANLKSAYMGARVMQIWEHAFNGSAIETITFAEEPVNAFTTIGAGAFMNTKLQSVDIPDTVTTIGGQAFFGTTSLKEVRLPASLVAANSVMGLHLAGSPTAGLKTVYMPKYSALPDQFFLNQGGIERVYFDGTRAEYEAMIAASDSYNQDALRDAYIDCTDEDIVPVTIAFTQAEASVSVDGTVTITVTGTSLSGVTFTADPEGYVTIEKGEETSTQVTATVTGVQAGPVTITAACGGKSATITVTVVNPVEDTLETDVTTVAVGKNDGAYSFGLRYISASGEAPAVNAAEGADVFFTLGSVTTVSTDEETGLVSATISVTPVNYGTSTFDIAVGSKSVTVTIEICSSGILYTATETENEVYVAGVGEAFPGGELYIPRRVVIDGKVNSVGRIGNGTAITTNGKSITEVHTGDGVMMIQPYAFDGISIQKAYIGTYVIWIWEYAFQNTGLEVLDLTNAVRLQTIGSGCFMGTSLAEVDFSNCATAMWDGVMEIKNQAFFNVASLTEVTFPPVGLNGSYCLHGSGVKTVNMGAMTSLPEGVFLNCTLETVNYGGTQEQFNAMKAACDSGTQSILTDATIVCTDGTITPPVIFEVSRTDTPICFMGAIWGVEYTWDFAPLNLFKYTGKETLRYTVKIGDDYATMNGSSFTYTFDKSKTYDLTSDGNVICTVTAYAGEADQTGISTTVCVVVSDE